MTNRTDSCRLCLDGRNAGVYQDMPEAIRHADRFQGRRETPKQALAVARRRGAQSLITDLVAFMAS